MSLHTPIVLLILINLVDNAPTSTPDCSAGIQLHCPPGHSGVPCNGDKPAIPGCAPCKTGTFSTGKSNNCTQWRICEVPNMTYLSRGNATSDTVCGCIETYTYSSSQNGTCIKAKTAENNGVTNKPGQETQVRLEPDVPTWVGYVIVVIVSGFFIALMVLFWFWTPCLRGEPDYSDDRQGEYYVKTPPEMVKLINRDLSDDENDFAVAYAVQRLPDLISPTALSTQELLSSLRNALPLNGQPSPEKIGADNMQKGLKSWKEDQDNPAQFSHLVEVLAIVGNSQIASQLTGEVLERLDQRSFT